MTFEVIEDGKTVFHCEDVTCIPSTDRLQSMNKAGYTFKLNGIKYSLKKLIDTLKEIKKVKTKFEEE